MTAPDLAASPAIASEELVEKVARAILDESERWHMIAGDVGEDDAVIRDDDFGQGQVVQYVPNGDGGMHLWGTLQPQAVARAAIAAARPYIEAETVERCIAKADGMRLFGVLGDWDKGYNNALHNLVIKLRAAARAALGGPA